MLIIEIALGVALGLILLPILILLLEKYIDAILNLFAYIVVISIGLIFFGFAVRNWSEFIDAIPDLATAILVFIGLFFWFAFLDLFIRPVFCKIWMIKIPIKINFEIIKSTYKQDHRSAIKMTTESILERGAIGMLLCVLFIVPTIVVAVIMSSFTDENIILIGTIVVAWIFAIATRRVYVIRRMRINN